ncbi:MAG: proliferating cell nuclear antigen (pcna) [Candidatus Woesearchaeota archaeon]|jgi:proliferating cell nuclear antigen
MKLTLAEPRYLQESIAIISELVNETRIKITKNQINLVAMDPANVAMVIFKLFSSAFVEYNVKEDLEIAVNLNNLKMILRRAKATDMLTLEFDATKNKLKITLKGTTTRTFYMPVIELEDRAQKIPELSFPVKITTTCDTLNEAIEDVDIVSDSVTLEAIDGKFVVRAQGDLSQANIEITESETTKIVSDGKTKVAAKYSIEYLKKMMKGSKLASNVVISFNTDYPVKIEYKTVDKLDLAFILAPRVDND